MITDFGLANLKDAYASCHASNGKNSGQVTGRGNKTFAIYGAAKNATTAHYSCNRGPITKEK